MPRSCNMTGNMIIALLLLIVCTLAQESWDKPCYYPDGEVSVLGMRCSDKSDACCPEGWSCLSNGLCLLDNSGGRGGENMQRHSCTSRTWDSPSCANVCSNGTSGSKNQYVLLCDLQDTTAWCCDTPSSGGNCCDLNAKRFELALPSPTATAPAMNPSWGSFLATSTPQPGDKFDSTQSASDVSAASASSSGTQSATTTSSSAVSSTPTSSIVTKSTGSSLPPGTAAPASSIISKPTASNSAATTAASMDSSPVGSDSRKDGHPNTILGVAIGVPVGLVGLAGLAFLLLHRHREMKANENGSPVTDTYGSEDFTPPPGKVELDAHSNTLNELESNHVVSELDGTPVDHSHAKPWTPAISPLSETHGSPIRPPNHSFWTPTISPLSAVQGSQVYPSSPHQAATRSAPEGTDLHTDNQKRYGVAHDNNEAPLTYGTLMRPISHMPPAM